MYEFMFSEVVMELQLTGSLRELNSVVHRSSFKV